MNFLKILGILYLAVGLIYAINNLRLKNEPAYLFPLNILAGPLLLLYLGYMYVFGVKKIIKQKKPSLNINSRKAIIFDLDGTVVNSEALWIQALENTKNNEKLGFFDFESVYEVGLSNTEIWKQILKQVDIKTDLTAQQLSQKTTEEFLKLLSTSESILTNGFFQISADLKTDRKLLFALTTNSHKDAVNKILEKEGILHLFDVIMTGEDIKRPKPNGEIYTKTLKKLKLKPQQALVFEDSVNGAKAADEAGIDTIIIWRDREKKKNYPPKSFAFINDFTDITPFVINLQNETQASQS